MNILYIYLLVALLVGSYTYYDTESYSCKESRLIHVFMNVFLSLILVWIVSIVVISINNSFGN